MDNLLDPFATADQNNTRPLSEKWAEFLDKGGRSAIAQAGLQMMQPVGWGETPMGNLGYALGSAGEALRNAQAVDQKGAAAAQKEESKQKRDEIAQKRLNIQEERLNLQKKNMGTVGRGARSLYGKKKPTIVAQAPEENTDENGDPIAAAAAATPAEPNSADAVLAEAKQAIARGADPNAVKARLRAMNIIPRGL